MTLDVRKSKTHIWADLEKHVLDLHRASKARESYHFLNNQKVYQSGIENFQNSHICRFLSP